MCQRSKFSLKLFFAGLLCFSFAGAMNAQEVWDLERCIQYAQQNSLNVKQSNIAIRNASLSEKQANFSRYPTLNASTGGNVNFGRTLDPSTSEFVNQSFGSSNISLNAGLNIYSGGRISNTIEQSKINTFVAKKDAEATINDLALNVASAYLSILLAEEQLETVQQRIGISQVQLERTDRLIDAGALPKNDRLDFVAQIARDEQSVVNAQNSVEINYLNLKQLLELAPDYELRIEKPEVTLPEDAGLQAATLRTVYNQALGSQPQIAAGELRMKSAAYDVDIARSGKLPSVTLFGNIDSYWSSRAKEFNVTTQMLENISFFKQLKNNFGQGVGLNVSVPIFNQYRNDIAMERAELGIQNQAIQNEQVKQQLKTNIQRAIADARAAEKSLEAAEKTKAATLRAYENAQKRFDLGAINAFELTTAKNNYDNSEVDLISAKYQYLFNIKVVDFYQGKPLKLD